MKRAARSPLVRFVRLYLWALLAALLAGFAIGIVIRWRLESRPVLIGEAARALSAVEAPTRAP
ncbi:MAG: hypothetical protein IT386_10580 [Deltaproteobacteria bacterium]|nr:hypothetical protein [Deltaproteobacteria bacterium]